jgi:uncharacterized membrane protein YqaE (UPF0057 family)
MKSFLLKFGLPVLMSLVFLGVAHQAYSAFPGKQSQEQQISVTDSNSTLPAGTKDAKAPGSDDEMILLVILAILLPPLAIYLKYDEVGKPFIINVILTLLCGLPGVIHALVHVLKK